MNEKLMLIDQFYHFDKPSNQGDCVELMNSAYSELKEKYPEYYIIRAGGTEPNYFFGMEEDTPSHLFHYFLLVFKNDVMYEDRYLSEPDNNPEIRTALKHDPLIVDPSFKRISRFSDSKYSALELYNQDFPITYTNSLLLDCAYYLSGGFYPFITGSVPLYLTSNEEMIYLSTDKSESSLLTIGFQPKKNDIVFYDLNSLAVKRKSAGEPKLEAILELLKKTNIKFTDENLYDAYAEAETFIVE
jgi:hypothetical protein